jgi:zinc D-Ala-D-Ala carboxypeptidase
MSTYVSEQSEWMEKWKNFKLDEFKCKCGCDEVKINSDMLDLIQEARDELGPLSITSGYRCPSHNASVSSTGEAGPHTTGHSLDISVKDSQHRKQLIDWFATKVTGLGIAKSFIHIDNLTSDNGFDMRPNAWKY